MKKLVKLRLLHKVITKINSGFLTKKVIYEQCHEKTCYLHMQKNKGADQLHCHHTANQHLSFPYID